MIAFAAGLFLVPVLDQTLKLLMLRGLAPAGLPLGPLGKLQVVRSQIWWTRPGIRPRPAETWGLWLIAAACLAVVSARFPPCGWFAGVLLGGSLSHAMETALCGHVIDYVRLRWWPAFNLADVAITVGGLGILVQLVILTTEAW